MDLDIDIEPRRPRYFRCLARSLLALSILATALFTIAVFSPVYVVEHFDSHSALINSISIKVAGVTECANPGRPYELCRTYKPAEWSCEDMRAGLQAALAFAVLAIVFALAAAVHGTFMVIKERAAWRHLDTALAVAYVVLGVLTWLILDRVIDASECEKVDPSREPPNSRRTYKASFHAGFALFVLPTISGTVGAVMLILRKHFGRCLWVDCCDTPLHPDERPEVDEETGAPRALQMRSYAEVVEGEPAADDATGDNPPT